MNIMWWLIWFNYVVLLVDTEFEISTVPDADVYGLAHSPSIDLDVCRSV